MSSKQVVLGSLANIDLMIPKKFQLDIDQGNMVAIPVFSFSLGQVIHDRWKFVARGTILLKKGYRDVQSKGFPS